MMKEGIELLWTKSNRPFSRLIRAVTGEKASHCVIKWNNFVIHSTFSGVKVVGAPTFLEQNEVIYRLNHEVKIEDLAAIVIKYGARFYDLLGFLYLGLRLLFPFLPKKNLWQITGMFMCTEFLSQFFYGKELSMITPDQLYFKLREDLKQ